MIDSRSNWRSCTFYTFVFFAMSVAALFFRGAPAFGVKTSDTETLAATATYRVFCWCLLGQVGLERECSEQGS
jgi:hypothetical protein